MPFQLNFSISILPMNSVLLPSADLCSLVPHSTRPVWHSWGQSSEENASKAKSTTARRRLFQEDIADEETNEQFVQRLLDELSERYKCKWGFDFETDRPVENAASCFEFESVPADSVPGFYRASNFVSTLNWSPNNSDTENHHRTLIPARTEEVAMMLEEEEFTTGAGHSPRDKKRSLKSGTAVLRKVQQKSTHTPKRRRSEWEQTRVTDFLSTRKHLPATNSTTKKDGICEGSSPIIGSFATECSPLSRRRHSLAAFSGEMPTPKKSVVRQRRYGVGSSSVASALFK